MKIAIGLSVAAASGGPVTTNQRLKEFTRKELKARGWTASMFTKLLPEPDRVEIGTTGRGHKYKTYFYGAERIRRVEKSSAFAEMVLKRKRLRPSIKKRKATLAAKKAREEVEAAALKARYEAEQAVLIRPILCLEEFARNSVDAALIEEFYNFKAEVSHCDYDYGTECYNATYRIKDLIVADILGKAKQAGWTYGVKPDKKALFADQVLYIDTPRGQVSFHLMPNAARGIPTYPGEWSGKRNTDQILMRLYSPRRTRSARRRTS